MGKRRRGTVPLLLIAFLKSILFSLYHQYSPKRSSWE